MVSKKTIRRLRLREGDIVVVKDYETRDALMTMAVKGVPPCQVVVAPNGVHRLSREYLLKLVSTAP